jgi:hypothetical protein
MAEAAPREFRVRIPLAVRVVVWFPVAFEAFLTVIGVKTCREGYGLLAMAGASATPTELQLMRVAAARAVLVTALFAAATVFCGYVALRTALEARRGSVVLEGHQMTTTNWRGRHEHAPWPEVEEARTASPRTICRGLRIVVRARGHAVKISPWVSEPEALLEEIVSRARLVKASETGVRARYLRCPGARG